MMNGNDLQGRGFSIPRILEVAVTAGIVGAVTLYGTTRTIDERLNSVAEKALQNQRNIEKLQSQVAVEFSAIRSLMTDIRIQLAERNRAGLEISSLSERVDRHEKQFDSIWPRLREMKERVQTLEPEGAARWQH
ncbi:MAG: hypothetical protein RIM72_00695 [Alphaproteobacteria bacterium]